MHKANLTFYKHFPVDIVYFKTLSIATQTACYDNISQVMGHLFVVLNAGLFHSSFRYSAVLHTSYVIWTSFCVTILRGPPIEFRVRENLSGALVGQLLNHSKEWNSSEMSRWKSLHFIIANQQDVTDRFAVSQDGTIYTQRGLDREERDVYRLTIITENSRGLIRGAGVYQVNIQNYPVAFGHIFYNGR